MCQKNNSFQFKVIAGFLFFCLSMSGVAMGAGKVRIDMTKKTHQKVSIVVKGFALESNYEDPEGLGKQSRGILVNDLKLSELFTVLSPSVYSALEKRESNKTALDYKGWKNLGAQWLISTKYKVNPLDKSFNVTFRVYDNSTEQFLLGKRYTTTRKFLRKIIHRFADEVVMQLTGKRGVAETKVSFLSKVGKNKEIFVVDFDGHNLQRLTQERSVILTPAWSPDGHWIVYTSFAANNPDLLMIGSSGRKKRRTLLKLPGLNAAPSWSPDGQRIALVLSKDQNSEIYVLERDFGLKRLTRHFNIDTSPTWSPDGKKIAFTSDRSGTGAPQIYIMDVSKGDAGGVKRITFGTSYNDDPSWSPDGDKIAFTSRQGKVFQIRIHDLTTKKSTWVTSGPGSNEQPSWSPDGRFLVYRHREAGQMSIFVKHVGSDAARQLTFSGGGGYSPAWSPYLKK
jgi:TolB protein